ncbi:MAG: long-chain fatty acid--CoA ligase [Burkholderiaceae bacterium]
MAMNRYLAHLLRPIRRGLDAGSSGGPVTRSRVPLAGDTVARKFWSAVHARGDTVALRQKEFGVWEETSWREYGRRAHAIMSALCAEGFQPGEASCILANTRREWSYADFGVLSAGGVSAGIYPTDAATQVEHVASDCGARIAFVEDDEQLDKFLQIRERLPQLRRIVVFEMDGLRDLDDPMIMSLEAFEAMGRDWAQAHPDELEQRLASRGHDDLAILVYTSGTTGKPKGAMLTNRNLTSVMENFAPEFDMGETDEKVSFLPLCHIAERLIGQILLIETGTRVNYVENPDTVAENFREIQPTFVFCVPRVWEKFYSAISIRMKEATRTGQFAYALAMRVAMRVADAQIAGRRVDPLTWLAYKAARFLVLNNVRRMIGVNRVRWSLTGAAPISPELIRWYLALGVPMFEGWGMTETCGAGSINLPGASRLGTIGKPQPYLQMRLSPEGEIQIQGPNVFGGYLNLPDKTAEAFTDDGWFRTGDVGTIDDDGYFRITDRLKDIIITAGGKNITPSEIENELKFSPYITDAVVIGDKRPYLTCLILIDHENVENYAQEKSVPVSNFASLCRSREVQDLIGAEIERANTKFARVETIKKFRLIEQQLTPEDEELTPTMKLKRQLVNRKYHELIEDMYR